MRKRFQPAATWGGLVLLILLAVAYLLGAGAVLGYALAHAKTLAEALDWWKPVAARPVEVLRLLRTEREVQTYALSLGTLLGCLVAGWVVEPRASPTGPTLSSKYGSHGTGRWATLQEVVAEFPEAGPGAVLGRVKVGQRWRPVIFPWKGTGRNRFVLIFGPPGSGKTSRYSLPNLIHAATVDQRRSLVISDPKGEMYRQTADLLQRQGFQIRVLNLIHPAASDRYNPMDYVRTVEDAFRLANTIITNTSGHFATGDAFWTNAERSLLSCLIWYVKTGLEPKYQHLSTVLHLGNVFAKDSALMEAAFAAKGLDPTAKRLYGLVASLSDKTRDGVFIGFAVRLQLWTSSEIAALTAVSDFTLKEVGEQPTALFLIIPDHHSTYQALTSLFFDQTFQQLIAVADENGGKLKVEVRLMLEEMANIGRIPDLDKRLATIRSRGLLVEMILQTVGQLKTVYGEAWSTIVGCADTLAVLAANDQETADWVSRRLGTSTIRTSSTSSTATDRGDSSGQSLHYTSRPLLLPDEVQGQGEGGLRMDELVLVQRAFPPARLRKYPVDEFPGAEQLVQRDPKEHAVRPRPEDPAPLPEVSEQHTVDTTDKPAEKNQAQSPKKEAFWRDGR